MARKTPGDATPKIICETEQGSDMELCFRVRTFFCMAMLLYLAPLSWNVSIKAAFSQVAEPFTQTAGCESKALTKPVYPSMMKTQLNNDLIVLVTGAN